MNDDFEKLDALARRARADDQPSGDVRAAVLRRLRQEQAPSMRTLAVFATGYAALAVVAAVFGVSLLNAMNDPLSVMFQFGNAISP